MYNPSKQKIRVVFQKDAKFIVSSVVEYAHNINLALADNSRRLIRSNFIPPKIMDKVSQVVGK